MSNPTASSVHVDAALTQLAIAWGGQQYIWDKVCPVVTVDKQSDKFFKFTAADLRRSEATTARAPGTLALRGGYSVSTSTYYCDNWAWAKATPDEVKRNADPAVALGMDQRDTEYCTEMVNRQAEIQQAADVFVSGSWDTTCTGVTASPSSVQAVYWSDYSNSSPIEDIRSRQDTLQQNTGYRGNRLWLGRQVYSKLLDHPDLIERMSTAATRTMRLEILAELFEVDQVIVGQASYNSAAEGVTASNSFVHGKHALLYYVPNSPALDVPSAMYTFRWGPRSVLKYRDTPEGKMADVVECHDYLDFVVTSSALGVYFSGIVA